MRYLPSHYLIFVTTLSNKVPLTRCIFKERVNVCTPESPAASDNAPHNLATSEMIEHYSHIRMEAKRAALDAIAAQPPRSVFEAGGAQNWAQSSSEEKPPVRN
jgi:hypothetical protein